MNIVLIGYMGSGKSLIGKKLAQTLSCVFVDLDTYISDKYNMSIPELFDKKGVIFFRKQETIALEELLNLKENLVLATGGGTPCYGNNMELINTAPKSHSLYLQTSVETLTNRLWSERSGRPLIAHLNTKEALNDFIRKHLFDRSPYYMQANERLKTDALTPEEVVEQIVVTLF